MLDGFPPHQMSFLRIQGSSQTIIINNYFIPHMGICQENISNVDVLKEQQHFTKIIHFYLSRMCVKIRYIIQNPEVE